MKRLLVVIAALVFSAGPGAQTTVEVVTTTEDLAALVREVGGDRVKLESIARGFQDPHYVEPKPSFILKLTRADMLVVIGRDLERGWLPGLIQQSRNAKIQPGGRGYLDASLTARVLEMPTGPVTRAMGDVHALGNPHYWLDPANGRRIALAVSQRLGELRPADTSYFKANYADFDRRLAAAEQRWDARMAPFTGTKIVTYHRAWSNFVERFGFDVVGYVEPKPGIPAAPSHTLELVRAMQAQQARLMIVEPYFDLKLPAAIARQAGARVLVLPPSVGGVPEASDYIALFDYNLTLLVNAIEQTRRGHHPEPNHHGEHR